jgi:hypothetical protein
MENFGREPTLEEVGARMLEALGPPAVPNPAGDNLPDGEGRREENVPELPWNVQIGGKDTWVGAKMGLGRNNDRAVDNIALAQLPGAGFRRDRWGNLIFRLPDDATVLETYVSGIADRAPVYEERQKPVGGQEFYDNRPGFSRQDAMNASVDLTPGVAGGVVGYGVGAVSENPLLGGAAGAATTTGANILLDELARRVGSGRPVDWRRAADEGLSDLILPDIWDAEDIKKNWLRRR